MQCVAIAASRICGIVCAQTVDIIGANQQSKLRKKLLNELAIRD